MQLLALLLLTLLCGTAARAEAGSGSLERLLAAAERDGLAADRQWRTLLHVQRGWFGDESLIDDPRFFLAPGGKSDPAAELRATLAAFLRTEVTGDDHTICRFPARFAWLDERLDLGHAGLPVPECASFRTFMADINPHSVILVFPVGYSNSPATMFGHTLLRIDSAAASDLLSTAVSYAAATDTSFGPLFAVKGLFGLYNGYYYVNHYYEKINEYSHIESRDIWEYALDLTPAESERLARHLWELKDLGSRYFFFNENCASNLLLLLEVARPALSLTDRPGLWLVPVDTLRRVLAAGIVTGAAYRPSRATLLRTIAAPLTSADRSLVVRIARGETPPEAAEAGEAAAADRARILDAAAQLHQTDWFSRHLERPEYARRLIDILRVRSRLESAQYPAPEPPRAEEGHGSLLLAAGAALDGGAGALALRLRPVYHGILDPGRGYQEGSAIAFGDTELRLDEDGGPRLERFSLIEILSLAPRDDFEQPLSWKVSVGIRREKLADGGSRTPGFLSWGGGWTLRPAARTLLYALPGIEARAGGSLEHGVAAGAGLSAGLVWSPLERWNLHFSGSGESLLVGERSDRWRIELGQGLALGRNDALQLIVGREGSGRFAGTTVSLAWNRYL